MIKILFVLGISILLIFYSCQDPEANKAVLKGTLHDANGFKLILQEMDIREIHSVDSVVPDQHGQFQFNVPVKESGFWLLKARSGKIMVLLLNPGTSVELSGTVLDFPDKVIVKGTEEAMQLDDFFRHTRLNEHKVDSLELLLVERQDSSGYYLLTQKIDSSFQKIWENQRSYEKSFINTHPGSLASLVVLNYAFGMKPVLSIEEDFNEYRMLDSSLFRKFPDNKHVKFHHQRVEMQKKAAGRK